MKIGSGKKSIKLIFIKQSFNQNKTRIYHQLVKSKKGDNDGTTKIRRIKRGRNGLPLNEREWL